MSKVLALKYLVLAAALCVAATPAAFAQTIECAAPANATEEALCADPALYGLEEERVSLVNQLSASDAGAWDSERSWIGVRDACGGDGACISGAYAAHNGALRDQLQAAAAAAAPVDTPQAAPEAPRGENSPPRRERRAARAPREAPARSEGAPLDALGLAIAIALSGGAIAYIGFAIFMATLSWRDFHYRTFANPTTLLSFGGLVLFIAGAKLVDGVSPFAGAFGLAAFGCWMFALLRNVRGTNVLMGLIVTFLQVTAVVLAPFALITAARRA